MKVLLINPRWDYKVGTEGPVYNRTWPPLSLANCATLLEREGFKVEVLDANALKISLAEVGKYARDFDKVFITSSTLDNWVCPKITLEPFLKTTAKLKEVTKELYVIGAHGTVRPNELLELTGARAVIRGEPEITTLRLCKEKDLFKIEGITFRRNGKIISNRPAELVDLKDLPMPALHLLPMEKYRYEILGNNFTLLEASRGCPYKCIFCLKVMYGDRYRTKSVNKLVKEIDCAINNYGVKTAYFIDIEFTLNTSLVEGLCDFLIEKRYDFKWCCQTRPDAVERNLLGKMKQAGCELIHFGVETGSPEIMGLISKQTTLEKVKDGIKMAKGAGIQTACFFMLGLPGETTKEMKKTIKFAKKLDPTYVSFHIAVPYPGTKFHQMLDEKSGFELFPKCCSEKHSLTELRRMTRKALLSFYLRPSYICTRIFKTNLNFLWSQFKIFLAYVK